MLVLSHLGFFIFECSALTISDLKFKTFSKQLHLHHTIGLIGYILAAYYDVIHYFCCFSFILEMTTPFSCVCWCLIKANKQNTLVWKANQLILVHLFHMRTCIELLILYEMYKYSEDTLQAPMPCLVIQIIGMVAVTFYLTPYWTYRKTQQIFNPIDIVDLETGKKTN